MFKGTEYFSTRKYFPQVQTILFGFLQMLCSLSSELDDGVHTLLTPEELHFVFGTRDPGLVSKEEYSMVAIKDTLQQAKQVAKRAGVMISVRYRNRS